MKTKTTNLELILGGLQMTPRSSRKHKEVVTAGVYVRQSTTDGQNSKSVDEQLEFIKMHLARESIRLELYPNAKILLNEDMVFVDYGLTGRVESGRESFQAFRKAMINKEFDVALVYDLSRLTREVGSLTNLKGMAELADVELISVSEMISSHSGIADESFIVKGLINQMYSKAISRQTRRALQLRAQSGKSTGHIPYGYTSVAEDSVKPRAANDPANKVICINEEEAEVVRKIYDLYAHTDMGIDQIARRLNQEGVRSRKNKKWGGPTIRRLLRQPKYIGIWVFGITEFVRNPDTDKFVKKARDEQDWIRNENENLRIVSQELWDKVQKRFDKVKLEREGASNSSVSLWGTNRGQVNHFFTGTMCCADCGGNFVVVSGRHGGYLGCKNAFRKKACKNQKAVQLAWVEFALVELIRGWLTEPTIFEYVCARYNQKLQARQEKKPGELTSLKAELQKVEKAILNLVRFLSEGNYSEAVSESLKSSEERKRALVSRLAALTPKLASSGAVLTPDLIRQLLVSLDEILKMDVKKANSYFRLLFPEPMRMINKTKSRLAVYEAAGTVNLGRILKYSAPIVGVPGRSRTCDLRLRKPPLYPTELRGPNPPTLGGGTALASPGCL